MPELRKDPIVGRWVIISSERSKRPSSFGASITKGEAALCPFCPTHEASTPPEIIARRHKDSSPNKPGWTLRVIPNKYPALKIEGTLSREPHGLYDRMNGVGAHEVIIETNQHDRHMVDMRNDELADIFKVYHERMSDLEKDSRMKYILIFKNHGHEAGASLEHAHSQLIATPIIPKRVSEELEGSKKYYEYKERCIYCDIIRQELTDRQRVVKEFDSMISIQPFAARFPFETWIIPKAHQSSYLQLVDDDFLKLAEAVNDSLKRLKSALNDPPFNFMLHTRPVASDSKDYYHWHIEIIPKLTNVAGFEWGSGFYINPTAPEDAAGYLRDIELNSIETK